MATYLRFYGKMDDRVLSTSLSTHAISTKRDSGPFFQVHGKARGQGETMRNEYKGRKRERE